MAVKERAAGMRLALRRRLEPSRPRLLRAAGCGMELALGLAMSAARVFGLSGPFGIGMVAEAGSGLGGIFCLLGASAGYLLTGGFDWGIRYVATCLLVFTVGFVFRDFKIYATSWFMPLVTAAITALTAWLNTIDSAATAVPAVVRMLTEVALAGGSAYFFRIALSPEKRETETEETRWAASVLVMVACALMALSQVTLLHVLSLGRVAAVLVVLTAARCGGLAAGPAAGAALGLAMDIAGGGTPYYAMSYGFCGLVCGVFSKHGKLLFTLSFVLTNALSLIWTWGAGMPVSPFYEAFVAAVIFLLIPLGALSTVGGIFQPIPAGTGESALRRYSAERVHRLGDAFKDLYDTVAGALEQHCNDNDLAAVFDRAADEMCVNCARRDECWQRGYADTLDIMNGASRTMLARGRLEKRDLPARFLEKCLSPEAFIAAVNGELRAMMFRRQFRARLGENRAAAYGQYADVSKVMESVSRELSGTAGCDPLAERRLLRFLRSVDVDAKASVFRDARGRLRAVIESGSLGQLTRDKSYLDRLSGVLGVRLCRPAAESTEKGKMLLLEAEPLSVSVGIAAMKKKGESVSGDRGTYFKTDAGVLCVILSDGMGSGAGAAREAQAAVRVLERFLRAGVEPVTAMKILNSVMLLKNGEDWGYATVDLVCIDLFTGETCFYKYGAAPSYVRTGKAVRKVRGVSMAAGLLSGAGAAPDVVRMRLKPGSVALIASDGVLAEENDSWVREMLSGSTEPDMKKLAREALQGAVRQYGCEDDMTVLAVRVDRRS